MISDKMNDVVLKIDNLTKTYRLGQIGTGTISHDLNRWWAEFRGKEDPFSQVGRINDRTQKAKKGEYVNVLNEINIELKRGEILGILGKNGAGKSTLLKVISRITSPTSGSIRAKGRIASLLEVGTGMHPEMTGRENVYLNGTILGMTKSEIDCKFDDIMNFAGCAKYSETPVKRYSSGMKVRLGFAVAAFLEPEILIVDEVLAVGDAEFQRKAIGKMRDISSKGTRTVIFVSHNMASIKSLCSRAIVLNQGTVAFDGAVNDSIDYYLNNTTITSGQEYVNNYPKPDSDILEVKVMKNNDVVGVFGFDESVDVFIKLKCGIGLRGAVVSIRVQDNLERNIFSSVKPLENVIDKQRINNFIVRIPSSILVPNNYKVTVGFHVPNIQIISRLEHVVEFSIEETGTSLSTFSNRDYGCVILDCKWSEI